jgi:CPA2 family monovalent cation:H+ antiporter-2
VPELGFLKDLVIVLGAAVVVVALLRRIGVPSIAGFILTGALVGPTGLGLINDAHHVEVLAEVGVVLLLFGIGLELSLDRLRRLWKVILLGGGLQVALTVACTAVLAMWFGLSPGPAIFLGCVVAVSSTAIVLRALSTSGELEAPHGRLAVGILVFQDLRVVPMMLAVPYLAGEGGAIGDIGMTVGTALMVLVGVLLAARRVVPRLLAFVARTRDRELFILSVFLVCFGTAWALSVAGISLALGAFLAGLVVAGSEFRHQAMSEVIPAREVLASLFFVSVGMLLNMADIGAHLIATVGRLGIILVGKFAIILGTALILRLPLRVGILSAATLCQIGEFSFVLLNAASGFDLLGPALTHNLLMAIVLSMLLTPLAMAVGPRLVGGAAYVPWLNRRLDAEPPSIELPEPPSGHVIVAGYGLTGQRVCRAVRGLGLTYVAVDRNPDKVRAAHAAGDRAVLGDVAHPEVLEELGCRQARLVVVNINDTIAAEAAVRTIRATAPQVAVIARAPYEMDMDALRSAGATEVIAAEATASDAIVATSLAALRAPPPPA